MAVNTFVFDAMPNSVSASTGAGSPSLRTPYPFATTTASSLTIASAMPGTSNVCIARATHASRSAGASGRAGGCASSAIDRTIQAATQENKRGSRASLMGMLPHADASGELQSNEESNMADRQLTPEQHQVLREHGTEPSGSSPLNREKRAGTFRCAGCGRAAVHIGHEVRERNWMAEFHKPLDRPWRRRWIGVTA